MPRVPLSEGLLEEIAVLGDEFATLLRRWKAIVVRAEACGQRESMSGIQKVRGDMQRTLDATRKHGGKFDVLEDKVKRLAEKAHAKGRACWKGLWREF